jgi:calcineurin-like phosphoesterase family protein
VSSTNQTPRAQSPHQGTAPAAVDLRGGRLWFTSDTHFGHQNIILYSQRPYTKEDGNPDVRRMNEDLVARWNARVSQRDTVIHLGDVAMGPAPEQMKHVPLLNGHKVLVMGNHDRLTRTQYYRMGFEYVVRWMKLGRLYLTHWPTVDGERNMPEQEYRDLVLAAEPPSGFDLVLHGHVHEKWLRLGKHINVGVDVRGYQPASLAELGVDEKLAEEG